VLATFYEDNVHATNGELHSQGHSDRTGADDRDRSFDSVSHRGTSTVLDDESSPIHSDFRHFLPCKQIIVLISGRASRPP
jgi:hypothetical protein